VRKRLRYKLLAVFACGTAVLAISGLTAAPPALASPAHTSPPRASATAQTRTGAIHIVVMRRDGSQTVAPRVSPCGGANGHILWHSGTYPWIQAYGQAWDTCGSGTYVQIYLSYDDPAYNNILIATAGPNSTVGFNTGQRPTELNPGNIGIAACEHHPSWLCGATVHV
jgi:hypothetical protein